MPDELELLAGTDPLNPGDVLRVDVVSVGNGNRLLQFRAHADRTYVLEKLTQFGGTNAWSVLQDQITGLEGPVVVSDPQAAAASDYRVQVTGYWR